MSDTIRAPGKPALKVVAKVASIALKCVVVALAAFGLARACYELQVSGARDAVGRIEASRDYDPDLLWNLPHGEPIFLVKPENEVTLFFFEGFRGQIGAGQYRPWFEELFRESGVNVIAPIVGLQGWPFAQRNREWDWREDMRAALQIYEAYVARLPEGHRVYLASMSFGALQVATIASKSSRRPDGLAFVAPLNDSLDYRSQSPLVAWLSTQTSWLRFVIPFNMRAKNKDRATLWDIVNDDLNRAAFARFGEGMVNPEENLDHGYKVNLAARFMEERLVPQISGYDALVLYGDSDLYFTQEGYAAFADKLASGGNRVTALALPSTGHMVLLDNGADEAKKAILALMGFVAP